MTRPQRAEPRTEVRISGYGAKIPDPDEPGHFLGDRVSGRAFVQLYKKRCRECGIDLPKNLSESDIDHILEEGENAEERATREVAVEFGERLAEVIGILLRWSYWRRTERIIIGGGMAARHVGDIAIHAAQARLMKSHRELRLMKISHHPNEAGLVGSVHLVPPSQLVGKDGFLAVDIGGSKVRAGIVEFGQRKSGPLADARVWLVDVWKYRKAGASQQKLVKGIARMLVKLIDEAHANGFRLSPHVRIGVPGEIDRNGHIRGGTQNLPGDWTDRSFNLSRELAARLPRIDGAAPAVSIHNDAVVQGLAELPFMRDVKRWGILTIGSGLGNAHFVNR